MPQEVISGYRSSAEGLNYEAVMKAIRRPDESPTPYRSIDSVREEQTAPTERADRAVESGRRRRVRVRKRRSSMRSPSQSFRVTKKGVFYVLATVGLLAFVKFTIHSAQNGGLIEKRDWQENRAILAR